MKNLRIGKKLALLVLATVLQLVCLAGVAVWAVNAMNVARQQSQSESRMMTLIQTVAAHEGAIAQRVATLVLSDSRAEQLQTELLTLRKEYLAAFDEIKSMDQTDEGIARLRDADHAAAAWREANNRVLAMLKAGKRQQAATLHDSEVVSRFHELSATIDECTKFRVRQLAVIDERAQSVRGRSLLMLGGVGLLWLALSGCIGWVVSRSITVPLGTAVSHLDQVAAGDVSRDVPREHLERRDEIGLLSKSIQTMSVNLRDVLKNISSGVHILSSSSAELSANSGQMSDGSRQASDRAHAVAAAAEQMTTNVTSVAAGMEQTSTNLTSVASATEQMTATIGEIAGNSEKARRITAEATRQAVRIGEQMNKLGEAAKEIGKVTETITEISSQTNLLALNATIEAARAGTAGKGFAVVANEIKELAQQTAAATEDIKSRIAGVQSSTAAGIVEIEKVSQVIHDVSEIVSSIAAAIEEQATVTKDIARNIGEASTGVRDANIRVAESSEATRDIAREIAGVDQAAREMTEGSEQVRTSATDLSRLAEQLQLTVARFHVV